MSNQSTSQQANAEPLVFKAIALHRTDARRLEGELYLNAQGLQFTHSNFSLEIPVGELRIRRGGSNNSLLFLSADSIPEWTLSCRQPSLLKRLAQKYTAPSIQRQVASLTLQKRQLRRLAGVSLLVLLCACWGLWQLKDPVVGAITRQVPISWEEKIGQVVFQHLTLEKRIVQNAELVAELSAMARPLLAILEAQGFKPTLHIVQAEELNAAALPGGIMIVHSGLLLRATRAEQVLGVLAHEMAHVSERHVMRGMISSVGLYFVFDLMLGNVAGVLAAAGQVAPLLLQQSYSRDLEREADSKGWQFLLQANIDPGGMAEFFQTLAEEETKIPEALRTASQLISTHPATLERIQRLQAMRTPDAQVYTDFSLAFEAFRAKLRTALEH